MNRPSFFSCAVSFLAGVVLPSPAWLLLTGHPVAAVQASILLASGVCLAVALSPFWVLELEHRADLARIAERRRNETWGSTELED